MTVRYVDPAAAGTNNGTSWTNAYQTVQQGFDNAVAGDIVYCRGHENLAATVDVDTNSGTNAAGYIKFIGCNAGGTVDGTRFVIHVNGGSFHGITWAGMDAVWLENIEVYGTAAGAYDCLTNTGSTSQGLVFINCSFHDAGRHGYNGGSTDYGAFFHRCVFYNCAQYGMYNLASSSLVTFSRLYDNTVGGAGETSGLYLGCLFYDNGTYGLRTVLYGKAINCVFDANGTAGLFATNYDLLAAHMAIGCRFTNHSGVGDAGIDANNEIILTGYNYYDTNTDDILNNPVGQVLSLPGGTTTSDLADQGDTNQGYTSLTEDNEDFNLNSAATYRRTAITIPKT